MNLMGVSNKDVKIFTTKNNNGQISRIDINFKKVSQKDYVIAIDKLMCNLIEILHLKREQ